MSFSLAQLGWQTFFQQQLTLQEAEFACPARVIEIHRSHVDLLSEQGQHRLLPVGRLPPLAVGDWLLLDEQQFPIRLLDRYSCLRRQASGSRTEEQLIAANATVAFVVSSLNQDFSVSRLERYLVLIQDAGIDAVVVLSKADLCEDVAPYIKQVERLGRSLCVEALDLRDPQSVSGLSSWCSEGNTLVVLGSSGVGKSTLINALLGSQQQATGGIREADGKGRHTTTRRSLFRLPSGGWAIDTPGMRELQLPDAEQGLSLAFADIESLAQQCRFSDCSHVSEPGCAVQLAIQNGELSERRLLNFQKLCREQAKLQATVAERRANDRELGKLYKRIQGEKRSRRE